jgi:hypothetical protein
VPDGVQEARGPGRPPTIWRLRQEAEASLTAELRELRRAAEGGFAEEHDESVRAIQSSLGQIYESLKSLETAGDSRARDGFRQARRSLERRIAATQVALGDLKSSGRALLMEENALARAKEQLNRLFLVQTPEREVLVKVMATARDAVRDYLGGWVEGVINGVNEIVPVGDWVLPAEATASPLLFMDGIAGSSDPLSLKVMEAGTSVGAPIMHIPVWDIAPHKRRELYKMLAHHLMMASGAATQIVYTLDSARSDAELLAQEFVEFDHSRGSVTMQAKREPAQPQARDLVCKVAPLMANAGIAAAVGVADTRIVAPAGFFLAGALSSRLADETLDQHVHGMDATHGAGWSRHLTAVCVDGSATPRLGSFFSKTGIDYISVNRTTSIKEALPGPLPFDGRSVVS